MSLTIGKKLTMITILFSLAAIVPFFIVSLMSVSTARNSFIQDKFEQLESIRGIKKAQIEAFFQERKSDMSVLVETVGTLRHEAFQKLEAVREVKSQAIEGYFQNVNDQIITFSEDRMIIEAMKHFHDSFRTVRTENGISPDELNRMRTALRTYYDEEFSEEYKKNNEGKAIDAEKYFNQLDDDSIALQYYYIRANKNQLGFKHLLGRADDRSQYSEYHAKVHPIIRNYLEKFGYYDIFLVDSDTGDIVYSVFKELDYSTSLSEGPYAGLNIGEAFRRANAAGSEESVFLVDYARYTPSYEAPAGFLSSPIYDGKERVGIAIFQIPIDRINDIMGQRAGLGKTGETYLVGPDKLMRSNSYLDPENHSVAASFKDPENGKVDTAAFQNAISGAKGVDVIIDYNQNPVLSAYTPIKVGDLTWALLAEIDVAEAFCPVNDKNEDFFSKYKELNGYYDLFLLNPDGYCFYTVEREADYQTNLVTGKYKNSGFGQLVRKVLDSKAYSFSDFAPYEPSKNEPAAFIAQPVLHDNQVELVVGLQLSSEAINSIMQVREGLGQSGETYLVGADKLMRSDSYLDPTNHSIKASFANPAKGRVDTEAVRAAISGGRTERKIVIDYNGNPVLSAYTPIQIGDTTWALLAEIDEDEVTSKSVAAKNLLNRITIIGIISCLAIFLVILFNVYNTGNLTKTLKRIIKGISDSAEQVASASTEISSASQSLADGASENASSLEETSSSLEEMSSTSKTNADSASQANSLMLDTKSTVSQAGASMKEMSQSIEEIADSGQEIGKIIKSIDEIAFQTNLLALNAAVEAARAGEAGAGFAVVADEVRNLAQRAAEAAQSTSGLIEGTIQKIEHGNQLVKRTDEAFSKVEINANRVAELVGKIASASKDQAQGIEQINTAIGQMNIITQSNASNAEESASASEELNTQAENMRDAVGELTRQLVGSKKDSGPGMSAGHSKMGGIPSRKRGDADNRPAQPGLRRTITKADRLVPIDYDDDEI